MIRLYIRTALRRIVKDRFLSFTHVFGLTVGLATLFLIGRYVGFFHARDDFHKRKDRIFAIHQTLHSNQSPSKDFKSTYNGVVPLFKREFSGIEAASRYITTAETLFTRQLPDGRLIISGGEGNNGSGVFGESPDFEIWNPYYLFKTARPVIQSLPAQAAHGATLSLGYSSSVPVSHVVIHRSGSQTHSFSYNQISVPVNFNSNNGSTVTFSVPNNANLLPPNYYMVFLMSQDGVPSVAKWVRIGCVSAEIFSDGLESGDTTAWSFTTP